MPEEEIPDFIELFYAKQKKAQRVLATAQHHHTKAYQKAVDAHLLNDNGEVDHLKLDDEELHEKFTDTLTDHYKERIIEESLRANKEARPSRFPQGYCHDNSSRP